MILKKHILAITLITFIYKNDEFGNPYQVRTKSNKRSLLLMGDINGDKLNRK